MFYAAPFGISILSDTLICSLDQFDCGHSVCIDGAWECDDESDCIDGRDEICGKFGCGREAASTKIYVCILSLLESAVAPF